MWCDGFDLDLLVLVPSAKKVLAPVAGVALMTHGRMRDGALGHPSVWNTRRGMVAFFGFAGPGKPAGYYTDEPVLSCTFEDAVRDAWLHTYVIMVERRPIWQADQVLTAFDVLMAQARGYGHRPESELESCRGAVIRSLRPAVRRFLEAMERAEIGSVERVLDDWMKKRRAGDATR